MCGSKISGERYKVNIDGVVLTICSSCYSRLTLNKNRQLQQVKQQLEKKAQQQAKPIHTQPAIQTKDRAVQPVKKVNIYEKFELVEDYAERIRRAREQLGWSQAVLAAKIKTSEGIIKRIESGKLRPSNDLAKKLEEVLKIQLLVPSIDEEVSTQKVQKYVTLGEIVTVRE